MGGRRIPGLAASGILILLRPAQVLAIFSLKTLPEPEEVSKQQNLEVKMVLKPQDVSKTKKSKVLEVLGLGVF